MLSSFLSIFITLCQTTEIDILINEWTPYIEDQIAPWKKNGISKNLIDETFDFYGSNIIYQHIDGKLYIYDPKGYCFCNVSVYSDIPFTAHLKVCRALESILTSTIRHKKMPNFELVWSLDDIPMWNIKNIPGILNETSRLENNLFNPGFGAIRCWSKGGLTLPFLGTHQPWNIDTFELDLPEKGHKVPLKDRKGSVVFRGSPKSCSFERDTKTDFVYGSDFSWTKKDCGRYKLKEIAETYPEFVNYSSDFMSTREQQQIFRYGLSVEGHGGWTDRLMSMLFGDVVIFNQDHPCDQWFEPLLRPYQHFVPVSHDFRNLPGIVGWANSHPETIKLILNSANLFADKYLRKPGIIAYAYTILNMYSERLNYNVTLRPGSFEIGVIYDQDKLDKICKTRKK